MAHHADAYWESSPDSGVPRRDRSVGLYHRYVPDPLEAHPVTLDGELARRVAKTERAVRQLDAPGGDDLASVARFLLRSEAIASSRIEGVAPSPAQVALAELGKHESVRGVSEQAQLVANNMIVVRRATTDLVSADEVTVSHVIDLHAALLPTETRHHGLRRVQNWIGGSDYHPIEAAFVPPGAELVLSLMEDLVAYLNGAAHAPLVQAALVHAQFETIHPFTDGNGRVGRALIHTVLARRGLTSTAVLPVSLVLATLRDDYVQGLSHYRYLGDPGEAANVEGVRRWVSLFTDAADVAAKQSEILRSQIADLRSDWAARVAAYRTTVGIREVPRTGSATARLMSMLPEAPIATANTLRRTLGVSFPAASAALEELRAAGILNTRKIERGANAYLATEVHDLVTLAERRLASTRFDTRVSAPNRPIPARPDRGAPSEASADGHPSSTGHA